MGFCGQRRGCVKGRLKINRDGSGIHRVHNMFRGGFRKGMETRMKPGGRVGTVCGGT